MNKVSLIISICCLLSIPNTQAQDYWVKAYEGAQSKSGNRVLALPNGDCIIAGQVNNPGEYYHLSGLLLRTSSTGDIIWERRIGAMGGDGTFTHNERFADIAISPDGYLYAVGSKTPASPNSYLVADLLVAKIDLDGNEIWRKYFNWGQTDNALGITILSNDDVFVCGNTSSFSPTGSLDGLLLKINANGEQQWLETFGMDNSEDWFYDLTISQNQEILLAGSSQLPVVGNRTWVLKTDISGNEIWQKTYGAYAIKGSSIVQHQNGNFGIAGQGYASATSMDNLLMEIDGNGNVVWGDSYFSPGPLPVPDELFDLLPCAEGGYVAAGLSGTNPFDGYHLLRVDEEGEVLRMQTLFDDASATEYARGITWAADGGLITTGARLMPGGNYDLLLAYHSGWGCSQSGSTGVGERLQDVTLTISPNPAKDFIQVNVGGVEASEFPFRLFDATGRLVFSQVFAQSNFEIICAELPRGVYFYSLRLPDNSELVGKLLVQ